MKATVIGANGYIARNLVHLLKRSPMFDELFLYDREDAQKDGEDNYESINILSRESVSKIRFDVDCVFMFVGKTGSADGFENPDLFLDINERALLYVLREYVAQGSRAKLIFPSTRLMYDNNSYADEREVAKTLKTIYAVNKLACENYLATYHYVFGIEYVVVRICIPYGTLVPGASSYGTAEFMLNKANKGENITLYGDGSQRRTLTFVGDICRMLIEISSDKRCRNETYNIGGEDYSLAEMAEVIAKAYEVGIEYIDYPQIAKKIESGDTVFNAEKLYNLIGTSYKVHFEDWVKKGNDSFR